MLLKHTGKALLLLSFGSWSPSWLQSREIPFGFLLKRSLDRSLDHPVSAARSPHSDSSGAMAPAQKPVMGARKGGPSGDTMAGHIAHLKDVSMRENFSLLFIYHLSFIIDTSAPL